MRALLWHDFSYLIESNWRKLIRRRWIRSVRGTLVSAQVTPQRNFYCSQLIPLGTLIAKKNVLAQKSISAWEEPSLTELEVSHLLPEPISRISDCVTWSKKGILNIGTQHMYERIGKWTTIFSASR